MLREYFDRNPDEREFWHYDSLRAVLAGVDDLGSPYFKFDESTPCHPTPIYELLLGIVGFVFLRNIWKPSFPDGRLFMVYLMTAAVFRFAIEFLRLQQRYAFGLSEAQFFSIGLLLLGFFGLTRLRHTPSRNKRQSE
jgi:prolipoprotein diacylglyceryltransferase